jgi:signal transduction histidine kinase
VHRTPGGQQDLTDRLRRLQAVTDAAIGHLSLDGLLDELLVRIRDVLEADTCAFLLFDELTNDLVARAAKGLEEEVERGVRIPLGKGFAGRIAAERRPVVIDDVDHADVLNPILREKGIKSLMGAPIVAHDRLLGVVHVGTLTPRLFGQADIQLLEIVAQRAALAIDRALVYEEVVRLTEVQREFIALAAHELRTPAATVYGLAVTLSNRKDLSPETAEEVIETLSNQAERLRLLVEQLLDLSRLDARMIEVFPERLQLRTELEEIIGNVAVGREEDVVIEAPEDTVVADRAVIDRVLTNLVSNALRYGAPPVRVLARQTDHHLRIVVEDSGKGIEPQFIPHLFDRFRRNYKPGRAEPGAGLGLTIARSYARAHGGDVLYDSTGRQGARFELVLPTNGARPPS